MVPAYALLGFRDAPDDFLLLLFALQRDNLHPPHKRLMSDR